MTTIINFILDHQEQLLMTIFIAIFSMVGTYLIYWITNKNKFTKYILGLVLIFISLYSLFTGLNEITKPEGVAAVSRAIATGVAGIVSLCFAMILGITNNPKKKKIRKKRRRKKENV